MSLLSIVIPAYNEEETIKFVMPALHQVLNKEDILFEVIFIDDGSTDATFEEITQLCSISDNIRGYGFSRNFGKEAAIWAGLQKINGDCCVVMDCDLQHPPEAIPEMYRLWEKGYDIVEGKKTFRGNESIFYRFFSGVFYRLISALSGFDMRSSSDFKLLDKRVVESLLNLTERNIFFRGLSFWVGFRSTQVEYHVAKRKFGKTKWNNSNLFKYAISNIIGFSTVPLQIVTGMGIIVLMASIALGIHTLIRFFLGNSLEGFTTVILLLLFIGGGIMISLGLIGLYLSKIYDEVKGRPRFIISRNASE